MSTLTYSERTFEAASAPAEAPTATRPPFWRRIFEAMVASRQRRAEREIAAYIAGRGGSLTDEVERNIMRGLTGAGRV